MSCSLLPRCVFTRKAMLDRSQRAMRSYSYVRGNLGDCSGAKNVCQFGETPPADPNGGAEFGPMSWRPSLEPRRGWVCVLWRVFCTTEARRAVPPICGRAGKSCWTRCTTWASARACTSWTSPPSRTTPRAHPPPRAHDQRRARSSHEPVFSDPGLGFPRIGARDGQGRWCSNNRRAGRGVVKGDARDGVEGEHVGCGLVGRALAPL